MLILEAVCAAQGLDLIAPLKPGKGVAAAHRELRKTVAFLEKDRYLRRDLKKLKAGDLVDAARRAVGRLA